MSFHDFGYLTFQKWEWGAHSYPRLPNLCKTLNTQFYRVTSLICSYSYLYWIKIPVTFQYQTTPINHCPQKIYFGNVRTNSDWTFPQPCHESLIAWMKGRSSRIVEVWMILHQSWMMQRRFHFWKLSFIWDANVFYLHQSMTFRFRVVYFQYYL